MHVSKVLTGSTKGCLIACSWSGGIWVFDLALSSIAHHFVAFRCFTVGELSELTTREVAEKWMLGHMLGYIII